LICGNRSWYNAIDFRVKLKKGNAN
jgi:hypothetical protein